MLLGLRSIIYPTADIASAKEWYSKVLGIDPYFDEENYVGFDVGGFELGLFALGDPKAGPKTYWGVADVDVALRSLIDGGATLDEPVSDVGGGIRMAAVKDPQGFVLGIIETPAFEIRFPADPPPGPGR